jgi:ribonuclease BN (tRNA processing enzyme)
MSPPYFPVDVRQLPSQRAFHTLKGGQCIAWKVGNAEPRVYERQTGEAARAEVCVVTQFTQSHPLDGALLYRVEHAGRRVVYATDVEWDAGCEPEFLAFVEGADLLIHDAQYTSHHYEEISRGYGHSTVEMAVAAARAAHVRNLILFHHEPTYDDDQLDRMEAEARKQFARTYSAYEGLEIDLLAQRTG